MDKGKVLVWRIWSEVEGWDYDLFFNSAGNVSVQAIKPSYFSCCYSDNRYFFKGKSAMLVRVLAARRGWNVEPGDSGAPIGWCQNDLEPQQENNSLHFSLRVLDPASVGGERLYPTIVLDRLELWIDRRSGKGVALKTGDGRFHHSGSLPDIERVVEEGFPEDAVVFVDNLRCPFSADYGKGVLQAWR